MSKLNKTAARLKRSISTRNKIKRQEGVTRVCVHRSSNHFYGQVTNAEGSKTFLTLSSLAPEIRSVAKELDGIEIAKIVGEGLAKKAVSLGFKKIAFDRAGYKYHGRVKAFAESLRENGLEF